MKRLLLFLLFILVLASCQGNSINVEPAIELGSRGEITIGSKSLTEQYLLMKMSTLLLKDRGYKVNEVVFLDSTAIRSAMEAEVIDVYWEYTTTARTYYHKKEPLYDPNSLYDAVSNEDAGMGIIWLDKSSFNSSWALLMRKDISEQLHIYSIKDLAHYILNTNTNIKIATNAEYLEREDGLERLKQVYEFDLADSQVIAIDSNLLSQTVKDGQADVAVGLASDPRIKENQLVILTDELQVFPPYDAAPVILMRTLTSHPDIREAMDILTPYITNENMLDLMFQIDILQKDITKTARSFLLKHELLKS